MISFVRLIIVVILLFVFIYTVSYGVWTWKKKNKFGAIMIFLVAIVELIMPIYSIFFREG